MVGGDMDAEWKSNVRIAAIRVTSRTTPLIVPSCLSLPTLSMVPFLSVSGMYHVYTSYGLAPRYNLACIHSNDTGPD